MANIDSYVDAWRARVRDAQRARRERASAARALLPILVDHLVKRYGARRVILWGSLATGGFHEGSDIDLVVEGMPPGHELFQALAELHDLAPDFRVDLVPWEDATADVREAAERDGELLYGSASP